MATRETTPSPWPQTSGGLYMRADASECFAYAGRYEIADGTVFHSIELSTNPALVGLRSTRHIELDGDRLTLSGPDFAAGTNRTQQIVWRRA